MFVWLGSGQRASLRLLLECGWGFFVIGAFKPKAGAVGSPLALYGFSAQKDKINPSNWATGLPNIGKTEPENPSAHIGCNMGPNGFPCRSFGLRHLDLKEFFRSLGAFGNPCDKDCVIMGSILRLLLFGIFFKTDVPKVPSSDKHSRSPRQTLHINGHERSDHPLCFLPLQFRLS